MKIITLLVFMIAGCSTENIRQMPSAGSCAEIVKSKGFLRCETAEVICYGLGNGSTCFSRNVKQTPVRKKHSNKLENKK